MRMTHQRAHRRQSAAALLTTVLPLASSVFLWASQSVAQENRSATTNNTSTSSELFFNSSDIANNSNWDNKPVIYVNNPKLLKEMQEQSFLRHAFRLSAGGVSSEDDQGVLGGGVPLLECSTSLASQLRHIANSELGVTHMQATFDELPYSDLEHREEETVKEMVEALERKFSLYSSLLGEMTEVATSHFNQQLEVGGVVEEREYHPCCLIPDNYLEYNSHFRTRVNEELWCDSGFGSDDHPVPHKLYPAPYNLTELFALNLRRYPTIKWQYFMSVSGLHTEYPAHRPGTGIGSDCGQWSRHRHVYEATVRPGGRNIVLLFDLGEALTPRLLLTAKTVGYQVLATLTRHDQVAVVGVAGSVARPAAPCMRSALTPATHHVLQTARHFLDYMEIQNEPTNHTLGLTAALELIRGSGLGAGEGVLLIYVSRGVVGSRRHARKVLLSLANALTDTSHKIVISTLALGLNNREFSLERQFLEAVAEQNFEAYGAEGGVGPGRGQAPGTVVGLDSTLSVAPVVSNLYDVVRPPTSTRHQTFIISEPRWDLDGRETVVSVSCAVETAEGKVMGLVGMDISLATLLEDVTHYTSPAKSYAFAVDAQGSVLGHPQLGRPETWTVPLVGTDVTLVEQVDGFTRVRHQLLARPTAHTSLPLSQHSATNMKEELHYYWHRSAVSGWVFVVARIDSNTPHKRLSRSVPPLPPTALFHRLDLIPPSKARVCRHFNQMATLDGSTLFLPVGSYVSPLSQMAGGPETMGAVQSVTAFLSDTTQLIANPGLRLPVRTDATAIYQISDFWESKLQTSSLSKYIIRRYAAAPSGVTVMYPGTLMDRSFDPRSQGWYLGALASPGKVIVSPPYLDPGGAGFIVTISHTVYQGGSATMHSPADPVVAVLAADFTLGYFYKLLLDLEPACGQTPHPDKDGQRVRCFLVDLEGYLVAHPSLLAPSSSYTPATNVPPHITHQEPVVSMELLGGGAGLLTKGWCGRWWRGASERHYSLRLPQGQVVASPAPGAAQVDNSCLQYALAAVPSTNLVLGIINQTCAPAVAFCPCSMDDRLCLNCQLVEAGACECPCECPLSPNPCSGGVHGDPTSQPTSLPIPPPGHSNHTPGIRNQIWQTYFSNDGGGPRVLELATQPPNLAPTCPRTPEAVTPLQYSIGLLSHLAPCVASTCSIYVTPESCLGVAGCVWCHVKADRESPISHPYCTSSHQCYNGVLGGPSPYPHGLATLPHSDNTHGESGNPIGPVAGGIMAVFMMVAVAVYCYRQHVGSGNGRSLYTPASLQPHPPHHSLYQTQPTHDLDNGDEDLLGDISGVGLGSAVAAAAVVSPYRMNPGYRRPPGLTDSSDQGYSTMTPHDDPDNPHYADLGGLSGLTVPDDPPSTSSWSPPPSPSPRDGGGVASLPSMAAVDPSQTIIPAGKRTGPNIIEVPVTVHMVDTV
ncbi:hypothetical protein Pcinc_028108 [Petrolisthes cinctipes]|uniref:VWFA and cache domain-containing protein 1 n=1 Tax=Petrolisthes cinctipes TaxID=88211 RepID=A0AAE1F3R2_PETCI|nr:hypothetical protein Pcinc_028108 [Petrolisthes cinctipes]